MKTELLNFLTASAMLSAVTVATGQIEPSKNWKVFPAPVGEAVVRVHLGNTIGNAKYDLAELINRDTGQQLFNFDAADDNSDSHERGYEDDSVVWSADAKRLAVYSHGTREGETIILDVGSGVANRWNIPDIFLPHEDVSADQGRQWQHWLKPIKWLSDLTVELEYSGVIQQQKGTNARIDFSYRVVIEFDAQGHGVIKSIEKLKFQKSTSWKE